MSLIQQQPNSTRKRPRSSFTEWSSILKNNFSQYQDNTSSLSSQAHHPPSSHHHNTKNHSNNNNNHNGNGNSNGICDNTHVIAVRNTRSRGVKYNTDTSVIILDSDTEDTYGLNNSIDDNDTDETDSIVFLREEKINPAKDDMVNIIEDICNDDDGDDDFDDGSNSNFFNSSKFNKPLRRRRTSNINDSFNLNTELSYTQASQNRNQQIYNSSNKTLPAPSPIQIGSKKRRTNSLPQLPLSQVSYRRVSESAKVGEIKPNLIVTNRKFSSCSSSYSTSRSSIDDPSSSTTASSTSSHSNGLNDAKNNGFNNCNNGNSKYCIYTANSPISSNSNKPKDKVTDELGYYIAQVGDYFANNRFKILGILGQGTFGKVIKALDYNTNETVAIKIIRAIPKYREASKIELRILTTLKNADPQNLNNCIHLREVFDYENHICIITDLLDISLFEFLQKNKFKPFPGSQIQAITRQLIRSVAFLHDLKLIHTDLKPENILLTSSDFLKFKTNKVLKNPLINIIDFGSAVFNDEYHSELVSTRHYRAPEIVLGTGWSFPCDMWSLGCILVELVTGEALFNTHENLEHLAIMEKVLGSKIPAHLIQKIRLCSVMNYFRIEGNKYVVNHPNATTSQKSIDFVSRLKRIDDLICSKLKLKISIDINESLSANWAKVRVSKGTKIVNYETFQFWYYFIDLVFKLLNYDPKKRITAIDALNHPWWDFGIIDEATSML